MTKHTIGTKAHCEAVQAAADAALGYPKKVSKGLAQKKDPVQLRADALRITGQTEFVERFVDEVDMPTYARVRKHPSKNEYAYPVTDVVASVVDQSVVDGAVELGEDWELSVVGVR